MRLSLSIAFLLGMTTAFLGVLALGPRPDPVLAQASSSGGNMVAVGGNSEPGGRQLLWVIDAKSDTPHLALYEWEGSRLVLQASRNIKYDLEFDQFPGGAAQRPTVAEAYKEVEKARKQQK